MKIKAVYLQAGKPIKPEVIEIDDRDHLNELYRLLNCNTIDVTYRQFCNNVYAVICDDEGALKECPITSAINFRLNQPIKTDLVGNLIVAGYPDDEGNLTDLDEDQIKEILKTVITCEFSVAGKKNDCYVFVV